jgi:poly(3-hydroxybutyrate) depolymerase
MRRWTRFAMAVAVLGAAMALPSPVAAVPRTGDLDQSDWGQICVNANFDTGRAYRRTPIAKANCREVVVDGQDRRFVAVVPRSALDRESRIPIVVFLHGSSGTGEQYFSISRWRELAHAEGFIAVFPSALAYELREDENTPAGRRSTKWNHLAFEDCEAAPGQVLADDVAFLDTIIDDIAAEVPRIDNRRIYVSGFSNGGQMATTLAIVRGDRYAATAAWAGVLPVEDEECDYDVPDSEAIAPLVLGVGSLDDRFGAIDRPGQANDVTLPMSVRGIELVMGGTFQRTTSALQLERRRSALTSVSRLATLPDIDPTITPTWSRVFRFADTVPGNDSGNELLFVQLDRCIHSYPNAWAGASQPIIAKSKDVSAAVLEWQYFLAHPMPRGGR